MDRTDSLSDALDERFGDGLRAVAVRSPGSERYDLRYERADVVCSDALLRDLLIESLYTAGQERLYRAGDLRAVVRLFDEMLAVNAFDPAESAGAFVGLDADVGADPTAVIQLCGRHCPAINPG